MDALEFSPFQERCLKLVELSKSPCRGRHSLRSAINHLNKGWKLRKIDPEMAVFRGLTAEEEAVSGIFYLLQYRGYTNSNLLNPRNHVHKNAAIPFLQILGLFFKEFSETERLSPKLHLKEEDGELRLLIALTVIVNGERQLVYPIPPLNFGVTSNGRMPSFKPQVGRFLTKHNSSDILKYIKGEANLRNRLLYAGTHGYPALKNLSDSFFELRRARVMAMVMAYLFIEPWPEQQPFVQQCLDAFLAMLKVVQHEMLDSEA